MRWMAVVLVVAISACGGDGGESLVAVCDDFEALVQDGERLPEDWSVFEPVVDRADDVDDLEDPAANIRSSIERDGEGIESAVTGFYRRCFDAGWER